MKRNSCIVIIILHLVLFSYTGKVCYADSLIELETGSIMVGDPTGLSLDTIWTSDYLPFSEKLRHKLQPSAVLEIGGSGSIIGIGVTDSISSHGLAVVSTLSLSHLTTWENILTQSEKENYAGLEVRMLLIALSFKIGLFKSLDNSEESTLFAASVGFGAHF